MITRIEVTMTIPDTRASVLQRKFLANGFATGLVHVVDVYTLDKEFSQKELINIAALLTHPKTQKNGMNRALAPKEFAWAIEVGFLPGVTDNVATTAKEMIEDRLGKSFGKEEGVYTSKVIYLEKQLKENDVRKIADSLYNPLIERVIIKNSREYTKDHGMGKSVPKVHLTSQNNISHVNLNVDDMTLVEIGKLGIANTDGTRRGPLALDLSYLKAIQAYFKKKGRNPTDVELESLAQTWSEHCKHTIFSDSIDGAPQGLYRTYIKGATNRIIKNKSKRNFCVSVFTDNSGAIAFDRDYLITHKVETHNSPSALDPFGGAITGIVGVNRDAIGFGLGAKPIMNMYGFCVGNPNDTTVLYRDSVKTQPMLSPRRVLDGVVSGINAGGNCSGIPTPQGFVYFDSRYKGKPLVFAGTVGLIPKKVHGVKSHMKKARLGDLIVMIGGRVGLDGIHGATFSSEALNSGSPQGAVQIGDPITQKKLSDAVVNEARDLGLYTSITDNGAGGLSCSVAEMAKESGGCIVELSKVPLKYAGLSPWQIWISESQERMTLAVPSNKLGALQKLMKRRAVEATVIGTFTKSGRCIVEFDGKDVMDIDMKFLHDGLPKHTLHPVYESKMASAPVTPSNADYSQTLLLMLSRQNMASYSYISSQYDYEVQGTSVLKPLQGKGNVNGDSFVLCPLLNSRTGIVLSHSLYPSYGDVDMYHMAASTIDTAIRNVIAAGADPTKIALLDNFCWCSGNDPVRLGQLVRTVKSCYDYAVSYQTPFISGKDSMFNDFRGFDGNGNPISVSIPPTLLISAIGMVKDVVHSVSLDAKIPGDRVYLLGDTYDELGGSEYYSFLNETQGRSGFGKNVPHVDAKKNWKLYCALSRCITANYVASAQSVGRGGFAMAMAKTAIGGQLGIDINLPSLSEKIQRTDSSLFSESQGRILITVAPKNVKRFELLMRGNSITLLGEVTESSRVIVRDRDNNPVIDTTVETMQKSYEQTFKEY